MIILGIDPGIGITGYSVLQDLGNRVEIMDYGAIRTDSKVCFPKDCVNCIGVLKN